jgi:hypothetical protein
VALLYPRGTILPIAQVPDRNNVNPKDRFVVLVRDLDDADPFLIGVAVTGTFTFPLPATSVRLPYHRQGRSQTGLTKDSVAESTWVVLATPQEILKVQGTVPAAKLVTILQQVQNHLPPPPPGP